MFINISYPLVGKDIVLENGIEVPEVISRSRISAGRNSNTSYFKMFAHTGTHLDAPWHFIESGKKISEFPIETFIFDRVLLLDIQVQANQPIAKKYLDGVSALSWADCVLLRTGFGLSRKEDPERYITENPGLSLDAAAYLSSFPGLRCIGMDFPSIENIPQARLTGYPVHKVLLGRSDPVFLLEDCNLLAISDHQVNRLFAIPLLLEGLEAAPVNALVEIT